MYIKNFYYRLRKVREVLPGQGEKYEIVQVRLTVPIPEKVPTDVIRIAGNGITIELPETLYSKHLRLFFEE